MPPAAPDPAEPVDTTGGVGAPRILVVDADDRTRESVVGILGINHRYDVVGSASHVAEALGIVRAARPDVVIVDPRLPDVSDGLALIRRIRTMTPSVAILAVGWSPDLEHETVAAGADGFVRKTFKPGDLSSAITRSMRRQPGLDVASGTRAEPSPEPVPTRGPGTIL